MSAVAPFLDKIHFEDFQLGEEFRFGAYEMTRQEMLAFATAYDPEPFHIDEAAAVDAEVGAGEATIHHFRLAHSSKPNASDRRRIGILFVYCPPRVRPTLGRYPALVVRGESRRVRAAARSWGHAATPFC